MDTSIKLKFPPDPNTVTKTLEVTEFSHFFDSLWQKVETRFFKFERLQSYHEPNDPSYRAFRKGNMLEATKLLEERIAAQAPYYESIACKGFEIVRVRAVELPLSDYLLYEWRVFRSCVRYGENILIVDLTHPNDLPQVSAASDFLLFDASVVLIHNYDKQGLLKGGWFIDNLSYVQAYVVLAEKLKASSVPLDEFERKAELRLRIND